MANKRKDSKGRILKTGESELKGGSYMYRYSLPNGKRGYKYDKTLEGLRKKEKEIERCKAECLRPDADNVLLNDCADIWFGTKKGLKDNTFQNYKYMYDLFVRPDLGRHRIKTVKHSDVLRYYNTLIDERGLKPATVDNIHTVLHQVFDLAVQDCFLRTNPSDNALRHLKQARNLGSDKECHLLKPNRIFFLTIFHAMGNITTGIQYST